MTNSMSIGEYLIHQLEAHGVRHVFGVPGDYILKFFDQLCRSNLKTINSCDEQGAGFAADAYSRVNGLGVVCVTYGVGGLKVVNTTAQAYAEKSPVVVISGAPGVRERRNDPLLHHKVRGFDTQLRVFEQITVASAVLSDPATAFAEIDRVLHTALRYKGPVYLELPRDMVQAPGAPLHQHVDEEPAADEEALVEALAEAAAMINGSSRPVILAGVEVHRLGLQDQLVCLAEKFNIPIASTLMGKSVVREDMPLFIGVYEGAMGVEVTRDYVESCDCLISLGVLNTDLDTGMFTARVVRRQSIAANIDGVTIRCHQYPGIGAAAFVNGLLGAPVRPRSRELLPNPQRPEPFHAQAGQAVTVARLFQRINAFLKDDIVVIADPGDALFGAADLMVHHDAEFVASTYYASLGFAVPGSIGVQLARPELRPLVLVGDGAFQMTGLELTMAARYGLTPIVVILNNNGYGTERPMLDGPFNDVHPWKHSLIPQMLGTGKAFDVHTEEELDAALNAASQVKELCILDVHLAVGDISPALKRLTSNLSQRAGR